MVTIIKRGELPKDRIYRCTCYNCYTEFEFTQEEGTYHSDQRDGEYLTIACPLCNRNCHASANLPASGYYQR